MSPFTFPLRYLRLVNEKRQLLVLRDIWGVVSLAAILSVPFIFTDANYFSAGGFLDKFGSFAGVLTGFYVAGLLAVATFASSSSGMNDVIKDGPIIEPIKSEKGGVEQSEDRRLSRRQYVCVLFGYLAFVSLIIALVAIILSSASTSISSKLSDVAGDHTVFLLSCATLFVINMIISNMVATTCHGLYYLIEKLYETKVITYDREGNPLPPPDANQ